MQDIYLVRHTAVGVPAGLCYGHLDVPLAATANNDMAAAISRLPERARTTDAVVSSPSARCLQLARELNPAPTIDDRLREFSFGTWEGLRWNHIPALQIGIWSANIATVRPPGGDNMETVARRAKACLDAAAARSAGAIVLITHGGVIRALIATLTGIPFASAVRFSIDPGSSTCIRLHARYAELKYLNRGEPDP